MFQNAGLFEWQVGSRDRVILSISAYSVKLIQATNDFVSITISCSIKKTYSYYTQRIIHRVPLHEIASVSYIKDDQEHLLLIKAGNSTQSLCPVYVFTCTKQVNISSCLWIIISLVGQPLHSQWRKGLVFCFRTTCISCRIYCNIIRFTCEIVTKSSTCIFTCSPALALHSQTQPTTLGLAMSD